ncbi:hypothetical protein [Planococcus lenghuensis]|uniref:Uncharacterized protein n=1 Tax=Planococcus lenghuensis TaxID=2213202 RepID=A0A1Q2KXP9_9BACL|nr:hypothetical protein [Planococcus lenghuensis]AQQ52587.1 hypothetical protein B0X71_05405 [Planococcus lenghuensis]
MSFGKYMTALLAMLLISRLTFLRFEFFDYRMFENSASVGKLFVELLLYGLIFGTVLFVADRFPDWRTRAKYRKRQQESDGS